MTTEWFYARSGTKHGPFSEEQIRQHAANRTLLPTDMIWCTGMDSWEPASGRLSFPPPNPSNGPPPLPADQPTAGSSGVTLRGLADKATSVLGSLGSSAAWLRWQAKLVVFKGRWCSSANSSNWFEFLPGDVFRTSENQTGRWSIRDNGRLLDMTYSDGHEQHYVILQLDVRTQMLQLQSADGNIQEYKRGKTDIERAKPEPLGIFDVFTKAKCPSCGKHAGEKAGKEKITESLGTALAYRDGHGNIMKHGTTWQKLAQYVDIRSEDKQLGVDYTVGVVVVKTIRTETAFRCSECSHEWQTESTKEQLIPATFRDPDETDE